MAALIGQNIAGFELLSVLGTTCAGVLYLGHGDDGRCIVKVLHAALCEDRPRVERAFAVAQAAAALEHRGIERIVETGWDGDHAYTLGDIVPGASAAELLARRVFEPESAQTLVRLVADALVAAHDAGICHRALDPAVLYVGYASDRIQLRDFGLPDLHPLVEASADGAAADIRALGALAMTLMTGKPADVSQSLRALVPEITVGFEELVAQMLADDPAERPTSRQIRDELGGAPRVTVAVAVPDPPRPRDVHTLMIELALQASDEVTPPPGPPPEDQSGS